MISLLVFSRRLSHSFAMRIATVFVTVLAPLLASSPLLGQEATASEAYDELLARYQKLESYFAVYDSQAPGNKQLTAAICFHEPGNMAAIQAEVRIEGVVVAEIFQAYTPELGFFASGPEVLHFKDTPEILEKLIAIFAVIGDGDASSFKVAGPAFFLTKKSMNSQLVMGSTTKLPWWDGPLPEKTSVAEKEELTIFKTPEGAEFRVQTETGILKYQNVPNEEGDRTLTLKDLQTDLSEEEIQEFIRASLPPKLKIKSLRDLQIFTNIQNQFFGALVLAADEGHTTAEELEERLTKAKPAFTEFFNTVFPPEFWESKLAESPAEEDQDEQENFRKELAQNLWQTYGLKAAQLEGKTEQGKAMAKLAAETYQKNFMEFAIEQTKQ